VNCLFFLLQSYLFIYLLLIVENLAFNKESWVSNRRQLKRHVRNQWKHGHASRAVDGQLNEQNLDSCTVLDNFDVDKPVWMVNVGRKAKIAGIVILTWLGGQEDNGMLYGSVFRWPMDSELYTISMRSIPQANVLL